MQNRFFTQSGSAASKKKQFYHEDREDHEVCRKVYRKKDPNIFVTFVRFVVRNNLRTELEISTIV